MRDPRFFKVTLVVHQHRSSYHLHEQFPTGTNRVTKTHHLRSGSIFNLGSSASPSEVLRKIADELEGLPISPS